MASAAKFGLSITPLIYLYNVLYLIPAFAALVLLAVLLGRRVRTAARWHGIVSIVLPLASPVVSYAVALSEFPDLAGNPLQYWVEQFESSRPGYWLIIATGCLQLLVSWRQPRASVVNTGGSNA